MDLKLLSKYIDREFLENRITNFDSEINKYNHIASKLLFDNCERSDFDLIVVVPTYKRSKYLVQTLESLHNQKTDHQFGIFVFDNSGIEDNNARNTIESIKNLGIKNVKYFLNDENIGMVGNWNRCISMADSEYVSMLHDDDLVDDCFVNSIFKIIKKAQKKDQKIGIVQSSYNFFFEGNKINLEQNKKRIHFYNVSLNNLVIGNMQITNPPTCGIVINKKAFIECGGFLESFYPSMDFLLSIQMYRKGYKLYKTKENLGHYRIAVNESLKKENLIGFCVMGTLMRNYAASQTRFLKLYWKLFGKKWYFLMVNNHFSFAKNNKLNVRYDELDVLSLCKKAESRPRFYEYFIKIYRRFFAFFKTRGVKL